MEIISAVFSVPTIIIDPGKIFVILCVKGLLTNGIVSKNLGKFYFFRYGHATMWLIGGNCFKIEKSGILPREIGPPNHFFIAATKAIT
jgi:hypothetical protein